jgi:hypothetical protein
MLGVFGVRLKLPFLGLVAATSIAISAVSAYCQVPTQTWPNTLSEDDCGSTAEQSISIAGLGDEATLQVTRKSGTKFECPTPPETALLLGVQPKVKSGQFQIKASMLLSAEACKNGETSTSAYLCFYASNQPVLVLRYSYDLKPQKIIITDITSGDAQLTVTIDDNKTIGHYQACYALQSDVTKDVFDADKDCNTAKLAIFNDIEGTSGTITGLKDGVDYWVKVRSVDKKDRRMGSPGPSPLGDRQTKKKVPEPSA